MVKFDIEEKVGIFELVGEEELAENRWKDEMEHYFSKARPFGATLT